MTKQFRSVVESLLYYTIEIDTMNAEQFDASVKNELPQFVLAEMVALQAFGYSISLVKKGSYSRIMIEKN